MPTRNLFAKRTRSTTRRKLLSACWRRAFWSSSDRSRSEAGDTPRTLPERSRAKGRPLLTSKATDRLALFQDGAALALVAVEAGVGMCSWPWHSLPLWTVEYDALPCSVALCIGARWGGEARVRGLSWTLPGAKTGLLFRLLLLLSPRRCFLVTLLPRWSSSLDHDDRELPNCTGADPRRSKSMELWCRGECGPNRNPGMAAWLALCRVGDFDC